MKRDPKTDLCQKQLEKIVCFFLHIERVSYHIISAATSPNCMAKATVSLFSLGCEY